MQWRMVKITKEILCQGMSINGGYSQDQLSVLGVSWPPQKGWKKHVIGQEFTALAMAEFLYLKDKHL